MPDSNPDHLDDVKEEAFPLCHYFGFDQEKIDQYVHLFELREKEHSLAQELSFSVIHPNLDAIVDQFYKYLLRHEQLRQYVDSEELKNKHKTALSDYLLSFDNAIPRPEYVESRLRIGCAHERLSLPLDLYQAAYSKLELIIGEYIPEKRFKDINTYLHKISQFDMALATISYSEGHLQKLQTSIDNLQKQNKDLQIRAETDALTGIHNRPYVLEQLTLALEHFHKTQQPLAVALFDFDNLRNINEEYGHIAGDLALRIAVARANSVIDEHHILGRYGGDEFLLVMPDADSQLAKKLTEDLRHSIASQPMKLRQQELPISISIGATSADKSDEQIANLIWRVDRSLKSAKEKGGDQTVFSFHPDASTGH